MRRQVLRVGIIGLSQSGKTVFLTSLIDHLRRHDPGRFPLRDAKGKPYHLSGYRALGPEHGRPEFPYEANRTQLGDGQWPWKTQDWSEFRCLIHRSDRRGRPIELVLTDFPGERMADLPMAGRTYAEWSDAILGLYGDNSWYAPHLAPYLDACGREDLADGSGAGSAGEAFVVAWRRALANCLWNHLPVVTPSAFALTRGGEGVRRGTFSSPEALAEARSVGRNPGEQFAPLPAEARERFPETAARFEAYFRSYRGEFVRPLARTFTDCEALAVLVDLTWILQAGPGSLHGTRGLLELILAHVNPGRTGTQEFGDRLSRLVLGRPLRDWQRGAAAWRQGVRDRVADLARRKAALAGSEWSDDRLDDAMGKAAPNVTRVAFVATKADKMHAGDRDRALGLLHELVDPLAARYRDRSRFDDASFLCTAMPSTRSLDREQENARWLLGRLEGDDADHEFQVSPVPHHWDGAGEDLSFPDVMPAAPVGGRERPLEQWGLEQVAQFLLNTR